MTRTAHAHCRATHKRPPKAITLDIDDTADTVHGHQQMPLFNAHHDERCFMPVHIHDADTGHCVVTILRPGKTPDGREVRAQIRRLVREIRCHWPKTLITIRGDSHYGRKEALAWCEQNNVRYIFGLAPNKILAERVFAKAEAACVHRVPRRTKGAGSGPRLHIVPICREIPAACAPGHRQD